MSIKIIRINIKPDGSVYHLNLKPSILPMTLFCGDQNRVEKITQFFDSIEFSTQREFKTQTGILKAKNYGDVNRNWS
jgi:uridine phosphorylase